MPRRRLPQQLERLFRSIQVDALLAAVVVTSEVASVVAPVLLFGRSDVFRGLNRARLSLLSACYQVLCVMRRRQLRQALHAELAAPGALGAPCDCVDTWRRQSEFLAECEAADGTRLVAARGLLRPRGRAVLFIDTGDTIRLERTIYL